MSSVQTSIYFYMYAQHNMQPFFPSFLTQTNHVVPKKQDKRKIIQESMSKLRNI